MSVKNILEVENLTKQFYINKKTILTAVENITFNLAYGETLGLVGESGCGKTTLGRTLTNIYEKTTGSIRFDGKEAKHYSNKDWSKVTQMIFQDPGAAVNPRMVVGDIIAEGLDIHKLCKNKKERREKVGELLELVGLNKEHANRFPHEFSGGQKQRIGVARALAVEPKFIVCDEPTSALDVSIQAQIINLLKEIQKKTNISYIFITHDLGVVEYIADRIGVMYLGDMVELTTSEKLFEDAKHPYTKALFSAIPDMVDTGREQIKLKGDLPSPINPPKGCKFCTRCPKVFDKCRQIRPALIEIEKGHKVACHLHTK